MPHTLTVGQLLGNTTNGSHQNVPRQGTRIRAVYDFLYANRGRWVEIYAKDFGTTSACLSTLAEYLMSSYGLDIRKKQFYNKGGHRASLWLLAGEWQGRVYIDYVAMISPLAQ